MRRFVGAAFAAVIAFTGFSVAQTANPTAAYAAKSGASPTRKAAAPSSNILFIIMDDVGIDQMKVFGYGGHTPPATPNLDVIAHAGVRFRNTWAMPECSPSRAIFFEGRFPLRTNIYSAILSDDLANSQVSPYEVTTPKILKTAGYQSAMFGKFHLAGPDNNIFENGTPLSLGWDHFDGFLYGAPAPIDNTIGGQFDPATSPYTCGFVPDSRFTGGADSGACYTSGGSCTNLSRSLRQPTPGFACLESGGLFIANQSCDAPPPELDCSDTPPHPGKLCFNLANGYYVWYRVINQADGTVTQVPLTDPRARGYVAEATNNSASQWIKERNSTHQPWMATISYPEIHTPYQQAPASLLPSGSPVTTGLSCTGNMPQNEAATRILSNQMLEAMDTEIGNLMVSLGLATFNSDGSLNYHPETTNTTVIIVGDNGTFAPGVKAPFDPGRAKGYVYQTGVWVPLIVAGPQVVSPDREVTSMVNVADLFELFGELAGVDVHKAVPPAHILDSVSMLPYLTNPGQPSLRTTNFTQTGNNIHPTVPSPCVIPLTSPPTCVQLFNLQGICEYEGGDWWGQGGFGGGTATSCCDKQISDYYGSIQILPDAQAATRNDHFKLVQKTGPDCNTGKEVTTTEFYRINEDAHLPRIDKEQDNLCSSTGCPGGLGGVALTNYNQLLASQTATLNSQPACPGDGNEDGLVNDEDIANWAFYAGPWWGMSSWYDFTGGSNGGPDGKTNNLDLDVILDHFGTNCYAGRGPDTGAAAN